MVLTVGFAADRSEVVIVVDHEGLGRLIDMLNEAQASAAPDHFHKSVFTDDLTTTDLDDALVADDLRLRLIGDESGRDTNPRPGQWMLPVQRPDAGG